MRNPSFSPGGLFSFSPPDDYQPAAPAVVPAAVPAAEEESSTNPLLSALGFVGNVLDTPGSIVRGLLARDPGRAFGGVFSPERRVHGRELLESLGWLGENEEGLDFGDVAGFGAEMATDPLNLLGAGLFGKTAAAASKAKASNAMRESLLAKGAMPEEVAKLTKVVDEAGKPLRTYHGTPHVFDQYDIGKANPNALYGKGIYTTDNPHVASSYAETMADPGKWKVKNEIAHYKKLLAERGDVEVRGLGMKASDKIAELERRLSEMPEVFAPLNVRTQFVDARNPFDIDTKYVAEELPEWIDRGGIKSLTGEDKAVFVRDLPGNLHREPYQPPNWMTDEFGSGYYPLHQEGEVLPRELSRRVFSSINPSGTSLAGDEVYSALLDSFPIPPALTNKGVPVTNTRAAKPLASDLLRDLGYDAIRHEGGKVFGGVPHQVTIAFDPSQIYSPWVAPALQKVPMTSPILAALGVHNAVARPQWGA